MLRKRIRRFRGQKSEGIYTYKNVTALKCGPLPPPFDVDIYTEGGWIRLEEVNAVNLSSLVELSGLSFPDPLRFDKMYVTFYKPVKAEYRNGIVSVGR